MLTSCQLKSYEQTSVKFNKLIIQPLKISGCKMSATSFRLQCVNIIQYRIWMANAKGLSQFCAKPSMHFSPLTNTCISIHHRLENACSGSILNLCASVFQWKSFLSIGSCRVFSMYSQLPSLSTSTTVVVLGKKKKQGFKTKLNWKENIGRFNIDTREDRGVMVNYINKFIIPHLRESSRVLGCEEYLYFACWNSRPHPPI